MSVENQPKMLTSITRALTTRVGILSSIAALAVVGVIVLSVTMTIQLVENRMDRKNLEVVRTLELFFLKLESNLLANSTISIDSKEPTDLEAELLPILVRNRAVIDVLLIDFAGEILAQRSVVGQPVLSELAHPDWLSEPPGFDEVFISDIMFDGALPMIDMAVLVTNEIGLSSGILLVRVNLTDLWGITLDLRVDDVANSGYVYLTDEAGQLVAFRNQQLVNRNTSISDLLGKTPQEIASAQLWFSVYRGLNGQLVLGRARSLDILPWFAVLEQPLLDALRPAYVPTMILLLILIGVAVIVFTTTQFMRLRIIIPLESLTQAVGQMTTGRLEQNVAVQYDDELGQLGH